MTITHYNSGAQAKREAAMLIDAGEFIDADTPAGQAVIDALPRAARQAKESRSHKNPSFFEFPAMKKLPSVETSVSNIGKIVIHPDRDAMRKELQGAMIRAAAASFFDSGDSKAVILCLAIVHDDTISIQVNTTKEDGSVNTERHAIFSYNEAVDALKQHSGLSARFEASFSLPVMTPDQQ